MPKRKVKLTAREAALYGALSDAESHLNFCGYGDAWERECAQHHRLEEKIQAALALCKPTSEAKENP